MKKIKKILSLFLVFSVILSSMFSYSALASSADITAYPLPSIYTQSSVYSMKANGTNIPIVSYNGDYDYGAFSMSGGSATIEITVPEDISSYSISPKNLNLTGSVAGKTLTFNIDKDEYLIVTINGYRKLIIMADPPETDKPASSGTGIFNVRDAAYSADNTGATLATTAIQSAIDAASAYNGGIVYVPAGVYLIGNLKLKSNMKLYLEGGAVLRSSTNKADFTMNWHKNSINKDVTWWISTEFGASNIKLYGRGTIDGNATALSGFASNLLVPIACSNFTVDGINFRDSSAWAITPVRSNDLTFNNLKMLNRFSVGEDDGIDVCESQNVVVNNSIGIALDDPYTTKTWEQITDISVNWPGSPEEVKNVVFDDCISWTICYGYKVGQGCLQNQSDIVFKNSVVYDAAVGIGVDHKYGTGTVSNVTFENIDIEKLSGNNAGNGSWLHFKVTAGANGEGPIDNVTVRNITVRNKGTVTGKILGNSEASMVKNLTLDNIYMLGSTIPASSLEEMDVTNTAFYSDVTILPKRSLSRVQAALNDTAYNVKQESENPVTDTTGGGIHINGSNGAYAAYNNIDFGTGVSSVDVRLASDKISDAAIELRLDSVTGPLIGTVAATGNSLTNYVTKNTPVTGAQGVHTLYLIFKRTSDSDTVANVNWIDFRYTKLKAENYSQLSNVETENSLDIGGGKNLISCNNGDWVKYDSIDFGSNTGTSSINLRYASGEAGGKAELHLDSVSGSLIGSVDIDSTGSWDNWTTRNIPLSGAQGTHDLYIVFKKADTNDFVKIHNLSFVKNTAPNELKLPTGITLNQASATLDIGQVSRINAVISPSDANDTSISWSVLSQSSAGVISLADNGDITALKTGTAVIRARSNLNPAVYADCNITVSAQTGFTIASIPTVKVSTAAGVAPVMPATVSAVTDKGSYVVCDVVWDNIDSTKYQNMGTFTVSGLISASGMLGTPPAATAEVTVGSGTLASTGPSTFELENLPYTASWTSSDPASPNPSKAPPYIYYGHGTGDWIEFPVNITNPGVYNVSVKLKKHNNKGIFQLYIDGVKQGNPYDQYASTSSPELNQVFTPDFGTVNFSTPGTKMVRFEITGKNAGSGSYQLVLDSVTFTPGFTGIRLDNSSLSMNPGQTAALNATFGNMDTSSATWSVLSESSTGVVTVDNNGLVSAVKPGTAVVRVASNKYSQFYADCVVRVKAAADILPVQLLTTVGNIPVLPSTVTVINTADNTASQAAVVWDSTSADYSKAGTVTITGSVAGITEPAIAYVKVFSPANPLKVACVGDSITNGNGTANPAYSAFPIDLGRILGSDYNLGKFGHSGATLLKNGDLPYVNQTEYTDSINFQPDVVIIQLGTNDSKSQNIGAHDSEFTGDYKDLISTYRNLPSHPVVYIALPPTVNTDDTSLAWGITNTVLNTSILPKIRQVADEAFVPLIDNNTITKNMEQNFSDKVHPNEEGAAILANNVFTAITGIPAGTNKPGTIEAESFSSMSGISTQTVSDVNGGVNITEANNGDWIEYTGVDFGTATCRLDVRVASDTNGGNIEFRLDSPTGKLIGTTSILSTGGLQTWVTKTVPLTGASGIHKLYMVFTKADSLNVANVNWIRLIQTAAPASITLNKNSVQLIVSQTASLTARVDPFDANTAITWSVVNESAPNIASVDENGVVTANTNGTAVIRAASTVDPSVFADCPITVVQKEIKSIPSLSVATTAGVAPVLPDKVVVTYEDDSTAPLDVSWDIQPSQYANAGTFTVLGTVSGTDVKSVAEITVNFAPLPVTQKFELESIPVSSSGPSITYGNAESGSSGKTAFLNNPIVIGDWIQFELDVKAPGTYNIVFAYKKRTSNGKYQLFVNGSETPQGNKTVDMSTGGSTFNTVDFGDVSISKAGKTLVRFKCSGAGTGSGNVFCGDYVTLTPKYTFTIDKPAASVTQGLNTLLSPLFAGLNPDSTGVKWSVASESAPNVAVVDDTGTVTGVNPGTAVIRATSTVYSNFWAESTVTVLPRTLTTLENVEVSTIEGIAPVLPDKVNATYDNGTTSQVSVNWNSIDPSQYERAGTFTVNGSVEGSAVLATATVTVTEAPVIPIVSIQPVSVATVAGKAPTLPSVVTAVYGDSTTALLGVVWNSIAPSEYAHAGSFTVTGLVEGTVLPAVATVTVTEEAQLPTIVEIQPVSVTTIAGKAPVLPIAVNAVYSDSTKAQLGVVWNIIAPSEYAHAGSFIVTGIVEGTVLPAVATVTVTEEVQLPTIVAIEPVNITTVAGKAPMLPTVVNAVYSDSPKAQLGVVWNSIDPSKYAHAGSFTVTGIVEGTVLPAVATVTVTEKTQLPTIVAIEPVNIATVAGRAPVLPTVVNAVYSDGKTSVQTVMWQTIDQSLYSAAGTFTVTGSVYGTQIPAIAYITVKSKHVSHNGGSATEPSTPVVTPPSEPVNEQQPHTGTDGKVQVSVSPVLSQDKSSAVSNISQKALESAFDLAKADSAGVKQIEVDIAKTEGAVKYVQNLPSSAVAGIDGNTQIKISTPVSSVIIPGNLLDGLTGSEDTVSLNLSKADSNGFNRDLIGNRPVISISIKAGDKEIDFQNSETKLVVSIPYNPSSSELLDTEHIVVLTEDGTGNTTTISNGKYDSEKGEVTFTTNKLGKYAVAYVEKTFTDLNDYSWAKHEIEVLASKGIINGTAEEKFTPSADITRADFMMLLVKAMDINARADENFTDVNKSEYYYNAVGAAKKYGITAGVGDNKFKPDELITRQDMMVLVSNALRISKKLNAEGSADTMDKFEDALKVSDYAREDVAALIKDGLVKGDGDKINPLGNTTRVEAAIIIYKIFNKK